ncbi:putative disease resistance protein At1g50180 [Rhododendron vialii]|uniref:putative disease resistance protein At1g50180 n=1 Tax=Rhododendron vialii TaxID=182163 RepID=UPI00265EEBE8|nr:putative disease resistance protein At1g50180 [Rhododendron vialii]XP_058215600.1 putative disease resistance protein At1g50180 [Rhododendron vialii]XP_058215601.1 putative disease resistance protein At1g50180 [Rhododendron vialii]
MAEIGAGSLMMKNLKELINSRRDLILEVENQINCLYEDLRMLSNFLKDLQEKGHEAVKNLRSRIRDVEYEAENILDLFVVNAASKKQEQKKKKNVMTKLKTMMMNTKKKDVLDLAHVKQEIEAIKQEVMEIYRKRVDEMAATEVGTSSIGESSIANTHTSEDEITVGVKEDVEITRDQLTSIANTQILADEIIVGFEEELTRIKDQLTGGSKRLQVVSIVGMAGLGKTTLARKVYNDPLVLYHFYSCAWLFVSQEYRKRELLHRLLSSVMQHTDGIDQMSEEELAQQFYKSLKGRRYLIVMDDIWDVRAWFDFKTCFPNDNSGIRILLTSRNGHVALLAKPNCPPLSLHFLTDDESWDLIQRKVGNLPSTAHAGRKENSQQVSGTTTGDRFGSWDSYKRREESRTMEASRGNFVFTCGCRSATMDEDTGTELQPLTSSLETVLSLFCNISRGLPSACMEIDWVVGGRGIYKKDGKKPWRT